MTQQSTENAPKRIQLRRTKGVKDSIRCAVDAALPRGVSNIEGGMG